MVELLEFSPGKWGQADAVLSLLRLQKACQAAVGASFYVGSRQDFIRDYATQVVLLKQNYYASGTFGTIAWGGQRWTKRSGIDPKTGVPYVTVATPGGGKHPSGTAADLTFQTPAAHLWFRANSEAEDWYSAGDAFGESWHKEYRGKTSTTAAEGRKQIEEEDSMSAQGEKAILDALNLLVPAVHRLEEGVLVALQSLTRQENDEAVLSELIRSTAKATLYKTPDSATVVAAIPAEGFWYEIPTWGDLVRLQSLGLVADEITGVSAEHLATIRAATQAAR